MAFNPSHLTLGTVKGFVDQLHRFFKNNPGPTCWPPKRAYAQEAIAQALRYPDWHTLQKSLATKSAPSHPRQAQAQQYGYHQITQEKKKGTWLMTFPWPEGQDRSVLLGPAWARYEHILDFARHTDKDTPVLWVQGGLAHRPKDPTHGFEHFTSEGPDLYEALKETIKTLQPSRIIDLLMAGMGEGEKSPTAGGQRWMGQARRLAQALIPALTELGLHHGVGLDVGTLQRHLSLDALMDLQKDHRLPPQIRAGIGDYLKALPGYQEGTYTQGEQTMDMHGSLQMQFIKLLSPAEELSRSGRNLMAARQILFLGESSKGFMLTETEKWALMGAFLETWSDRYPEGRLIIDGLAPSSRFSSFLSSFWAGPKRLRNRVLLAAPEPNLLPEIMRDNPGNPRAGAVFDFELR